jgi:hypothetical protein
LLRGDDDEGDELDTDGGLRDRPSVELSSDSSPFDGAHQSPSL